MEVKTALVERKNKLGNRLTELMTERGMSVSEAARIAKVARSSIQDWRSGAPTANFEALQRLANALGVSLAYLLTGIEDSRPEGSAPAVSEVFRSGGSLFDGYARIYIERLIPKSDVEGSAVKKGRK